METIEQKEKFIELRAKGYSFDKIAKELGRAKQTLIDWSKELEEEIANHKALELEALYEKYYLHKENRLQTFGELLGKIKKEIEKRNLSDVSTEKLLELYLKYQAQAKEEVTDPVFKSSKEVEEERADKELLDELTTIKPSRKLKAV
jgi:transposase